MIQQVLSILSILLALSAVAMVAVSLRSNLLNPRRDPASAVVIYSYKLSHGWLENGGTAIITRTFDQKLYQTLSPFPVWRLGCLVYGRWCGLLIAEHCWPKARCLSRKALNRVLIVLGSLM